MGLKRLTRLTPGKLSLPPGCFRSVSWVCETALRAMCLSTWDNLSPPFGNWENVIFSVWWAWVNGSCIVNCHPPNHGTRVWNMHFNIRVHYCTKPGEWVGTRHPPSHLYHMVSFSCGCCYQETGCSLFLPQEKTPKETAGLGRGKSAENNHTELRGWEGHPVILDFFFSGGGRMYQHFSTAYD